MADGPKERPLVQMLKIVDVIDCVPGHAPNVGGRPIAMLTVAHLGEMEQTMAISFEDTKLLVTKLLEVLDEHGHQPASFLLNEYFTKEKQIADGIDDDEDEDDDEEESGEDWKN